MTTTSTRRTLTLLALSMSTSLTAIAAGNLEAARPGHAAVYLMRAFQEAGTVELFVDGKPVATLPANGHTVVQLHPGQRRLSTIATGTPSDGRAECVLDVRAGERHFINLGRVKPAQGAIGVDLGRRITTPTGDGTTLAQPPARPPAPAASASATGPCQLIAEAEARTALGLSSQRVAPALATY